MEAVLDELGIKPIVAVIPESRDQKLMFDAPDEKFWHKVRAWQSKNWTIALHGHTHQMHKTTSPSILPYHQRSEFVDLPYSKQAEKMRASWQIFTGENVYPKVWVAPAHCFDEITLQALCDETGIKVVSDGLALDVYYERGLYWIPQQLWSLTKRFFGLWTVVLHPNSMSDEEIKNFGQLVRKEYSGQIISFSDIKFTERPKTIRDRIYNTYFWLRWRK